ncbi:MAG: HD domain-containing protein [Minisyncoccia bacterium]
MLNRDTLVKIKEIALKIDNDIAFGGKSKGNKHLFRVVRVAKFLAQKMGANSKIAMAGALLHDTALPSGNDYNYLKNKEIVILLLKPLRLSKDESDKIAECVASHEGTTIPKSLEAKIVHDADVLEKTGLLGIIRHTWKMTNSGKLNHERVNDQDIKRITNHMAWRNKKLQTLLAKEIATYLAIPLNKQKTKTIITMTADMAFDSIVTEKIAVALRKRLNKKENEKLKEQLNLGYLRKF